MNLTDVYDYIKKNLADDYSVLKNKVDEFAGEGLKPIRIYNILSQYIALKPFCRALDVKNGDYIEFIKAIKIATFLKAKFNNEDAISVMQNTLIYEDNDVCIFKPTNFQESSIIGEPICCFAYSQGRWDEHYYGYQEAIYYVYDVMRENSIHDFVAITVRPSGRALVLDKEHNWWSPADSIRYIKGLGEGAATIVTKEGKSIKTENKQYNTNMNKKLIRLTESDLHRIVKESVNTVLTELNWKTYANAEGEALKRSIGERPLSKAKLRKKDNSPYESFNDIRYANRRFRDAKVNAFNDTHNGAKMTKRSDEGPTLDDYDYLKTGVGPYFGNGYTHYNYKDERYKPDFLYSDADKRASEDTLKDTQEYSNYLKGNYDYQSDKGWQLKR